jgi:hypothetical protein
MPEAETRTGDYTFVFDDRAAKVRVVLYSARGICHLTLTAPRFATDDRLDLLPPSRLKPLVRVVIDSLRESVWPVFVKVTEDGEIVWDQDWDAQVRFKRLDLARNLIVDDEPTVKAGLMAKESRYQKRRSIDLSSKGGWTISNRTNSSGMERFYDKTAEMGTRRSQSEDEARLVSDEKVFRFEAQIMKDRLEAVNLKTLADLTDATAWRALEARWDATQWGRPLPGKTDLLEAVSGLPALSRMALIGFLHMAAEGQLGDLSPSQLRLQRERAKACGLTPGTPVRLLGQAQTLLDLHAGIHRPLTDAEKVKYLISA